MQSQVLARPFCVSEMFEVDDAAIRQVQKVHGHADYQVSTTRTKKKELRIPSSLRHNGTLLRSTAASEGLTPNQTLLPLHLSFCRTTLKNDASGNDASGSVLFALRTVTIDPRST